MKINFQLTKRKEILKTLLISIVITSSGITKGQTVGLFVNDPGSYTGYTLFAPNNSTSTYLINNDGLLIHEWQSEYTPALTAYLLEDGTLLRSAKLTSPGSNRNGGFQKIAWDGTILWEYYEGYQHHDIEPLPNGNVLLIINDVISKANATAAGRNPALVGNQLRSLSIQEVAEPDTIVWEWRIWDHLIQDFDNTKSNYGIVTDHPELMDLNCAIGSDPDWLHTNSIDYHSGFDQILITNRNTNEIWIIDHSTTTAEAASHSGGNSGKGGDLLYRWGNSQSYNRGDQTTQKLYGPHSARWIEPGLNGEGNILVFNNGFGRPEGEYSTVEEIVPPVDEFGHYDLKADSAYDPAEPHWIYMAEPPTDFFSARYSNAQRLPNGNTLICSADSGIMFEITPDNELVWKYINPVNENGPLTQGETTTTNDVYRCYRYATDYSGLVGDLTPGDPIELPATGTSPNKNIQAKSLFLYDNYPNPFNNETTISYDIPEPTHVKLTVYDILGNEVLTLVDDNQGTGNHVIKWNSTNKMAGTVGSGIYFYSLQTNKTHLIRKMILLK